MSNGLYRLVPLCGATNILTRTALTTNVSLVCDCIFAPLPPPNWTGVFNAVDDIYQCPQYNKIFGVVGTEDCLKINVYVPAQAIEPLPVMVYIHGGAFIMGNGGKVIIGPDFIVKRDVILVTFNYRLGALGFLCLGTNDAPGNAGLKDQVAALKWIKRNIAAFKGDPENVTVFGTSAGGASVSLLVASEGTHGLFKRAIVHSGSALAGWAVHSDPVLVASKNANLVGHNTKDPKELHELFARMPFKDLIAIAADVTVSERVYSNLLYLPCIENNLPDEEPIISDLPYNLLKKSKNISMIYSSTNNEGLFCAAEETEESLLSRNDRNLFVEDLVFESKEKEKEIAQKVKELYFGKENVSMATVLNMSDLYGHLYFEVPVILEAEMKAKLIDAPVYNYYFTYSGGRNVVKSSIKFHNETGACHGDDMFYKFNSAIWPYKITVEDQLVVDWLTTLVTNFAKYGDPTPEPLNNLPVNWKPHTKDKLNFLEIGKELKMVSLPKPEVYQFWKEIYTKYRRTKISW